jgi:hypothetical protein
MVFYGELQHCNGSAKPMFKELAKIKRGGH